MNETVVEINKETGEYVILSSSGSTINVNLIVSDVSSNTIILKIYSNKTSTGP
jgi:hypothetical protein